MKTFITLKYLQGFDLFNGIESIHRIILSAPVNTKQIDGSFLPERESFSGHL